MSVGDEIWFSTVRKSFPGRNCIKDRAMLFIAGGIGLAPLRSVINTYWTIV